LRVVRTPGIAEAVTSLAAALRVEEVDVPGPPTSAAVRGAGWAEAAVLFAGLASLDDPGPPGRGRAAVTDPRSGGRAVATVDLSPASEPAAVEVVVDAGDPLDEAVLRSYVTGAAHMALGWVCSEGIAVGEDGVPDDLTVRSWGILRARDTPPVSVVLGASAGPPVAVADAAFAAVAAACWIAQGLPPTWPTRRR
jgi:CO/xanthine dehydrogenase Mo-binding subunit